MSDRPTITNVPAGGRYSTAALNSNFQALRNKFDGVVGTNGVGGDNNSMLANLDMNTYNIINAGSILDSSGLDLAAQAGYAEEWASKAEGSLVSVAAGGDLSTEYSSLHWAAKAAADVVLTNADVVSTNADVVSTAADVTTMTGAASTTSLLIAVASKAFTVASGLGFAAGDWVLATSDANPDSNYMHGPISSYSGTTLTINVDNIGGSGTLADWTIRRSGTQGATGDTGATGSTGPAGAGDMSDLVDDLTPQLGGDLDANGSQIQWSKGADVASGTALPLLTDGNYFDVTGTTTVTSMNTTGGAGTVIKLHFDGAVTLTHHATNLVLAGAANFTTEAGDELEFTEYGAGTYRMTGWSLAGTAPGGGGGGAFLGEGASGASVGSSGDIIRVNEATLNTSQSMAATDNGSATGPLSIASGVTLTISSGSTFVVI